MFGVKQFRYIACTRNFLSKSAKKSDKQIIVIQNSQKIWYCTNIPIQVNRKYTYPTLFFFFQGRMPIYCHIIPRVLLEHQCVSWGPREFNRCAGENVMNMFYLKDDFMRRKMRLST